MSISALTISDLTRSFDDIRAVDGISFEVERGETFGLLGPNGAGKTTTINLLLGILKPDRGSIRLGSAVDPTKAEVRKRVGVAPQSLSLYEDLTGEENLAFFGKLYGLSGKALKARTAWALDFAGLHERRGHRVSTYSGGMKRRLNLATGLIHDPEVIFLDEPTVGMDPQSRNLVFDRLEDLKKQGRTILYTSHYMEEVQRLCDRVAILEHGKILAMDTVDALIDLHGGFSIVEVELTGASAGDTSLPGRVENGKLRIETGQPLETIAELGTRGAEFTGLIVHRPNLETVFLNLTGRKLRDE